MQRLFGSPKNKAPQNIAKDSTFKAIQSETEQAVQKESLVIINTMLAKLVALAGAPRAALADKLLCELAGLKVAHLGDIKAAIYERAASGIESFGSSNLVLDLKTSVDRIVAPADATELNQLCPQLFEAPFRAAQKKCI